MSADGPAQATNTATGNDYHGYATRRLANQHVWVEVLATAGPRIVRVGLAGSSRNLLASSPCPAACTRTSAATSRPTSAIGLSSSRYSAR